MTDYIFRVLLTAAFLYLICAGLKPEQMKDKDGNFIPFTIYLAAVACISQITIVICLFILIWTVIF